MKKTFYLLTMSALLLSLGACKKKGLHPTPPSNGSDTAVDVYIGGYVDAPKGQGITQVAAYWKNGTINLLGDTNSMTLVKGIAVSGPDVYVVATQYTLTGGEYAIVWKNGTPTQLSPDSAEAEVTCIGIQGSDVYIGGYTHNIATQTPTETTYNSTPVYWKNGVVNHLPNAASISAITVSGSDVYFAGSAIAQGKFSGLGIGTGGVAAWWKNGSSPVTLDYPSTYLTTYSSAASAIAVSGANVYTAGYTQNYQPEIWKNNAPAILQNSVEASSAQSVATSGNDVYIAGVSGNFNVATVWKNNIPLTLNAVQGATMTNSEASAVAVAGNNVYVTGYIKNATGNEYSSYYWKNTQLTPLSNGIGLGAFATCMVLAPKN